MPLRLEISAGVNVILGDSGSYAHGEEESMMVPYSRNEASSNDRNYETTALVSQRKRRVELETKDASSFVHAVSAYIRHVTL